MPESVINLPRILFFSFIYAFNLAALGLCCCTWAFSSCGEQGLLFVAVRERLIGVVPLLAEYGLEGAQVAHGLRGGGVCAWSAGSAAVLPKLSRHTAYGVFLDQGLNLCLPHWQSEFQPLAHLRSPTSNFSII